MAHTRAALAPLDALNVAPSGGSNSDQWSSSSNTISGDSTDTTKKASNTSPRINHITSKKDATAGQLALEQASSVAAASFFLLLAASTD